MPDDNEQILDTLARAFRSEALGSLTLTRLPADSAELPTLSQASLPQLVVPEEEPVPLPRGALRILVAAEGADRRMALALNAVLNPATVVLAVTHVTWVPGIATSPIPPEGLDDPKEIDLLLYRGAREALINTADDLRGSGFQVTSHLRENRRPADALLEEVRHMQPAMVALGLGRHGAGIGRDLLRHAPLTLLYVQAR